MSLESKEKKQTSLSDKLQRLTKLLLLEQKARQKKDSLELGFTIVNHTHELCSYKRCLYWERYNKNIKCLHVSGVSRVDENSALHKQYVKIIKRVVDQNSKKKRSNWARLTEFRVSSLTEKEQLSVREYIGEHVLIVEFVSPEGRCFSGLAIESDAPFSESDKALLEHVCESYAHALYSLEMQQYNRSAFLGAFIKNRKTSFALALMIGCLFIPIKSSVTVPAEIISKNPYIVSAPFEGIIKDILVNTNQSVLVGTELVLIDDTDVRNRLEISEKELAVLKADLEQSSRQAFTEKKSKAQTAIISGQIERQLSEVKYLKEVLNKTIIKSPRDGIVIFNDPNKIRGQLFKTGQKIMIIANPQEIELQLRIPADAMIKFDHSSNIDFYLNEDPYKRHEASFDYIEYQATKDPDGLLTYKLYAQTKNILPIGARGTAKIFGQDTTLGQQIFRRPIASLRRYMMW